MISDEENKIYKIAKYSRISIEKKEMKVQKEDIDNYVKLYFSGKKVILGEYSDEGYSGKDMNRKQMERMKNDIIAGNINTVIAWKLDRLGRNMQDLLLLFDFFENQNVVVMLVKDKIDTSTPQGRLLFHIMGAFAEFERETTRERLQAGRDYAKIHGTRTGKPLHRPRKEINMKECVHLYNKGMSLNRLGKLYKVHAATIKSRLVERGILQK